MRIVYLCRSTSNRFMALTISEFTRRLDGTCERSSEPEEKQRGEKMSEMNEREKGGGGGGGEIARKRKQREEK